MTRSKQMAYALSIRQPWAWLIAAGYKDIENRNWATKFRGEFYIHASKTPDETPIEIIMKRHNRKILECLDISAAELKYGGIIGRAELVDCVQHSLSSWFEGPEGFLLRNAELIDFIPYRGKPGFFPVEIGGR